MTYDLRLKDNEKIIDEIRRYGLTFFGWWIFVLVFVGTPFFFMFWLFNHSWWGQALFFIPITLGILVFVRTIFLWRNNVAILTTHRLIDIHQQGLFDKTVSRISYDQIEDVSGRIKGFWGTVCRFGSVSVQISSDKTEIVLDKVKRPADVQHLVQELQENFLSKYTHDFSGDVAGVIAEKLYELDESELIYIKKEVNKLLNRFQKKVEK